MFGRTLFNFGTCQWDHSRSCMSSDPIFQNYQFLKGETEYEINDGAIDFYLAMLAAGVTENMLFSSPNNQYKMIESNIPSYMSVFDKWCAAVYSGRYEFAKETLLKYDFDFLDFRGFEQIVLSENADFIDFITDNGSNEMYKKIMLNILAQDYLRGGRSIYGYVKRYCPDKNLSDGEYLDRALLSLNDPDRLYNAIFNETQYIINENDVSVSVDEYNRLAAKLMCRCAELGMKLKRFDSFRYLFIFSRSLFRGFQGFEPVYGFEDKGAEGSTEYPDGSGERFIPERDGNDILKHIELPVQLADLIDADTEVYGINSKASETVFLIKSQYMSVYFSDNSQKLSKSFEELEYIGIMFREKYGYKLKLKADHIDLKEFDGRYADIIEFDLSRQTIAKICNRKKLLKNILNKNILSKENIEALIKYSTEAFAKNKNNKNALIALRELNDAAAEKNI